LFIIRVASKLQIPSLENPCQPLIEDDWWQSTKEMSTEQNEKFPRWPALFEERRTFCRAAENQPCIEWLQTPSFVGEEDEAEDEDDDDVSSEHGQKVGGDGNDTENKDENRNDDRDAETCNWHSKVRLFMAGMTGDEDTLHYRNQVEEVASVCEQASLGELETETGQDGKHVALLDDRNVLGIFMVNKGLSTPPAGYCRPYLGPLTAQRLGEELSRKVA
jgi:hypothetical protein